MTEEPWACILSFNRRTKEMLHQEMSGGESPAHDAQAFLNSIRNDFPASEGWHHAIIKNDSAADVMTDVILGLRP